MPHVPNSRTKWTPGSPLCGTRAIIFVHLDVKLRGVTTSWRWLNATPNVKPRCLSSCRSFVRGVNCFPATTEDRDCTRPLRTRRSRLNAQGYRPNKTCAAIARTRRSPMPPKKVRRLSAPAESSPARPTAAPPARRATKILGKDRVVRRNRVQQAPGS